MGSKCVQVGRVVDAGEEVGSYMKRNELALLYVVGNGVVEGSKNSALVVGMLVGILDSESL